MKHKTPQKVKSKKEKKWENANKTSAITLEDNIRETFLEIEKWRKRSLEIHDDVLKHKKAEECHIDKLIISLLKKTAVEQLLSSQKKLFNETKDWAEWKLTVLTSSYQKKLLEKNTYVSRGAQYNRKKRLYIYSSIFLNIIPSCENSLMKTTWWRKENFICSQVCDITRY